MLLNKLHKTIASGFGLGFIPLAPGTMGSIGAFLAGSAINMWCRNSNYIILILIVIFFFLGVYSANQLEKEWGKDPSRVVIDEVVGMWISMIFVPFSWITATIALVLFRFFDILKPLYIRKMEDYKGGWGVMMDDVLAGIYANIVLQIMVFVYTKI